MGTISLGKDNFEIHSGDQALQIIKNAMPDENEIWISGDNKYPSMAICSHIFNPKMAKCGFHTMKIIIKLSPF